MSPLAHSQLSLEMFSHMWASPRNISTRETGSKVIETLFWDNVWNFPAVVSNWKTRKVDPNDESTSCGGHRFCQQYIEVSPDMVRGIIETSLTLYELLTSKQLFHTCYISKRKRSNMSKPLEQVLITFRKKFNKFCKTASNSISTLEDVIP